MPDVFLSYNREDQAVARRFAEAFASQDLDVWWDATLKSGKAYDQVTEKALREAKAVVVLWSPRSVDSRWVRAEATLAHRNKTLMPVMIEPCERPIMFELTHTAELSHWKGDLADKAWLSFLDDVRRLTRSETAPAAPAAPASVAPPPPAEQLLAVLPFDNLSSDAEMQFFSDGVSEEIIQRLCRAEVKVVGRTSSFQFRGGDKIKAASALRCSHILDGSIRRAAGRVRIVAHLVEVVSQRTLWSERYDRDLDDIFAVQDEISEQIATALHKSFRSFSSNPVDPAVYDLYLRTSGTSYSPEEQLTRIGLLEVAAQRAPHFAEAWGRLAFARGWLRYYQPFATRAASAERMLLEAGRALALDPQNTDALGVKLLAVPPFGSFLDAEAAVEKLRSAPRVGDANLMIAWHLRSVGRTREGAKVIERALGLDALNHMLVNSCAVAKMSVGRFAEAVPMLEGLMARFPDMAFPVANLLRAYTFLGDWAAVDRLLDPAANHPLREFQDGLQFFKTKRDPSQENMTIIRRDFDTHFAGAGGVEMSRLVYAAHLGLVDHVYETVEAARLGPRGASDDVMGPDGYRTGLLFWDGMPEVRNDPRFVKLCARLGLVEYWLTLEIWPDCAEEVGYDFKAECEKHRGYPKDKFFG